jgi:ATP synthase protein I
MKQRMAVYKGLGGYGTLGLEIVLSLLFGLFGGSWLDGKFGTEPVLLWVGFALGVGAGVRSIQRALAMMKRETEREEREEGNPEPMFPAEHDREAERRERVWDEEARRAQHREEES